MNISNLSKIDIIIQLGYKGYNEYSKLKIKTKKELIDLYYKSIGADEK